MQLWLTKFEVESMAKSVQRGQERTREQVERAVRNLPQYPTQNQHQHQHPRGTEPAFIDCCQTCFRGQEDAQTALSKVVAD